jgi:hypothetical protein
MKINPNYTGGEIAYERVHANCTIITREPVFDGLFRERRNGFVQIDWKGEIPENIQDTIDFNLDSIPDFLIRINTREPDTKLEPMTSKVIGLGISTPTSYGWAARINLVR